MATVEGQINNVRKALEEYEEYIKEGETHPAKKAEETHPANQTLINSWSTIEWCLEKFAESKGVKVDPGAKDDGSHSFHENLIAAFSKLPLNKAFPSLSSGPIQGIFSDSKLARNMWSKPKQFSDAEVEAEMHKMVNGFPIIINALEDARKRAGLN
jgi:hypothetical protein